jgi:hypothetical protein
MPEAISADFPGGNVGLSQVNILPDCVQVTFTAHPRGGPEALWFCTRALLPADYQAIGKALADALAKGED